MSYRIITPRFHSTRILTIIYAWEDIIMRDDRQYYFFSGEKKLIKLDYFLRYPNDTYPLIEKRAKIMNISIDNLAHDLITVPMQKWLRGPWDLNYYDAFAYASARNFMEIKVGDNGEFLFYLIKKGHEFIKELIETDKKIHEYYLLSKILKQLFKEASGSEIEGFIKENDNLIVDADLREYIIYS